MKTIQEFKQDIAIRVAKFSVPISHHEAITLIMAALDGAYAMGQRDTWMIIKEDIKKIHDIATELAKETKQEPPPGLATPPPF